MYEPAGRGKEDRPVKQIAVVGAGTMGHGIAQVAATAGYEVTLTDVLPDAAEQAMARIRHNLDGGVSRGKLDESEAIAAIDRIRTGMSISEAVADADLVIEAIIEDLDAKASLFTDLHAHAPATAILATNTSSLSVAAIAAACDRPDRVVGMHFFNPVHIMKLVEIVEHAGVDPAVIREVREVAVRMGKDPIVVRDSPGFASSRLGVVLGLEAMRMLEQGVASAEDIDKAMHLGYRHPMGPLKVTDLVGLDVRLAIAEYLHRELGEPHYAPPQILRDKVARGELGKKSGKGFYEWPLTAS